MVSETRLDPHQLIYPLFVKEGIREPVAIQSMPGIFQWPLEKIGAEAKDCFEKGVRSVLLFGIPEKKDDKASTAIDPKGLIPQAIQKIKEACPEMFVITDVCLCEYMSHGHCGLVNARGEIENDSTVEILSASALAHVRAGSDLVAPSDMMDGRIGKIRTALDQSGFSNIPIMSYAVKYASAFYGPFREAAESTPQFGDRKTYQMDPANSREAIREALLDEAEGADILMVKPALPYLDILQQLRSQTQLPLAAYQVSGEYTMIQSAIQQGWLKAPDVIFESLLSIKRAGASMIVTYFAKQIALLL